MNKLNPGTETELLAQLTSGSTDALEQIFRLYKNNVFNLVLGYVQNHEDAEEITQDVFVEVYKSASSFRQDASLKTWLYRIATNKALDFIRYKKRKKRFGLITSLFSPTSGEPVLPFKEKQHPGVELEDKEKAYYLFKAINALPENQKTAFVLLKVELLSQKEAAEVMQINEKALESLYQRAKANLRKTLEKIYEEIK